MESPYREGEKQSCAIHPRTNHAQAQVLRLEHPGSPITENQPPQDADVHGTAALYEWSIVCAPKMNNA